jgi:hypothetical protein
MPPVAREAYNQTNPKPTDQYFGASVPLRDLRSMVQRAIEPKKPKPTEPQAQPNP